MLRREATILQQHPTRARAMISELGARFIRHGSVVMTHAYSRVVLEVFKKAVAQVLLILHEPYADVSYSAFAGMCA